MARRGVPLKLQFNEGIFRLGEKPDVRGKPSWLLLRRLEEVTRPRGRNTEPARAPKPRWNAQANATYLQRQKRRPYRQIADMARYTRNLRPDAPKA